LLLLNLKHAGFDCQGVGSARLAQQSLDRELPDLVLLDWMLPDQDGLSVLKQWRAVTRTQELPVLMLTARGEEEDIVAALEAGADDYVVKPFRVQELLARVRALLRRASPETGASLLRWGALQCAPDEMRVCVDGKKLALGPTEFRLLAYMLANQNKLLRRSVLLDKVWGDHVFIEERTVDVHIRRLRAVLMAQGNDELNEMIETVRGGGYRITSHQVKVSP
jgi:two-component system phosphate regulon response regulator PhoB